MSAADAGRILGKRRTSLSIVFFHMQAVVHNRGGGPMEKCASRSMIAYPLGGPSARQTLI
jgi:hypothetical protein